MAVLVTSVIYRNHHTNIPMESTIGLRFSAVLPSHCSFFMPSGLHAVRAAKPYSTFFHSSLSLPKSSSRNCPTALASPFHCNNVGSGMRSNHRCNVATVDGLSQEHADHHPKLMEMVENLKQSQQYDTALEILKLHEPNISDKLDAAYHVKMEIMHILHLQGKSMEALAYAKHFYDNRATYAKRFRFESFYASKLMEIALDLKESKHYDLAVKLLKEQEPEVQDDPDASYYVKMEIMHLLYLQEKYDEARNYADELEKKEDIYLPHFKVGLFYALKSGILCALDKDVEAIKYMEKFKENRSEAIPLLPPDRDESTKNFRS